MCISGHVGLNIVSWLHVNIKDVQHLVNRAVKILWWSPPTLLICPSQKNEGAQLSQWEVLFNPITKETLNIRMTPLIIRPARD